MERIQVGEDIKVVRGCYESCVGSVKRYDKSDNTYFVNLPGIGDFWLQSSQIERRVSASPGKPVTSFEVGKWYTYPGHYDDRPFQCERIDSEFAYFGDAGKNGIHPSSNFREVPAPSQGHTHSVEEWARTPRKILQVSHPIKDAMEYAQMAGRIYRMAGVDVQKRTITFSCVPLPRSPISTRAAIRRRLLGL